MMKSCWMIYLMRTQLNTGDAVTARVRGLPRKDLKMHVHQTVIMPGHCLPEEKDNRSVADAVRLCTVSEKHDAVA